MKKILTLGLIGFLLNCTQTMFIKKDKSWTDITEYTYKGLMTTREYERKRFEEGVFEATKEEFESYANRYLDDRVEMYWLGKEGSARGFAKLRGKEPDKTDIQEYNKFIESFKDYKKDLVEKVYVEFQKKIGGKNNFDDSYANIEDLGQELVHPAVLLSQKQKGICLDKAFALLDIYTKLGVDAKLVTGFGDKKGHAWVRIYEGKKCYDLDPTKDEGFTPRRYIEK